MAALARLLERLLWPARKEEEAEEEEEGCRSPNRPQSLLDAPRCAQRPHGGAAAAWGLRFGVKKPMMASLFLGTLHPICLHRRATLESPSLGA